MARKLLTDARETSYVVVNKFVGLVVEAMPREAQVGMGHDYALKR